MKTVQTKVLANKHSLMAMAALCAGIVGCAGPDSPESDDPSDGLSLTIPSQEDVAPSDTTQRKVRSATINGVELTPDNQQEQMATQALEATELVQIVSAISGNLAVQPGGLGLNGVTSKAIDNMLANFGGSCVEVAKAPGAGLLDRTVTFTYTACTGPFKHLTLDGTSTTKFELDALAQKLTVTTDDDLVITKDGQPTPVHSTRTGTLSARGLVLHSTIDFVDFTGEQRCLEGMLDLSPNLESGCVDASMSASELNGLGSLDITDLSVCADGNVCVETVTLEAFDGAVNLSFDRGQVGVHFSAPSLPQPIDASLPVSIPSCVNVGSLAGVP